MTTRIIKGSIAIKPEDEDEIEVDIDEKLKIIEDLTEKVDSKEIVQFDQNVLTVAVLSCFKPNRRKLQLTQEKQVSNIYNAFLMLIFELGLICCYVDYIVNDSTIDVTFLTVKQNQF